MSLRVFQFGASASNGTISRRDAAKLLAAAEARREYDGNRLIGIRLFPLRWWSPYSAGHSMMGSAINAVSGAKRQRAGA